MGIYRETKSVDTIAFRFCWTIVRLWGVLSVMLSVDGCIKSVKIYKIWKICITRKVSSLWPEKNIYTSRVCESTKEIVLNSTLKHYFRVYTILLWTYLKLNTTIRNRIMIENHTKSYLHIFFPPLVIMRFVFYYIPLRHIIFSKSIYIPSSQLWVKYYSHCSLSMMALALNNPRRLICH